MRRGRTLELRTTRAKWCVVMLGVACIIAVSAGVAPTMGQQTQRALTRSGLLSRARARLARRSHLQVTSPPPSSRAATEPDTRVLDAFTQGTGVQERAPTEIAGSVLAGSSAPSLVREQATKSNSTGPPPPSMSLAPPFASASPPTPKEREDEARSRTRFEHMSAGQATALAERDFQVQDPSWRPPGSEPGSRVTRYLTGYTAEEERPGNRHVLVQSTVPLETTEANGQRAPVSLSLEESAEAYVPTNPLVPVSIPKRLAADAAVGGGVRFTPVIGSGGAVAGVHVGDALLYPNSAADTDFMLEAVPYGLEASWELRSETSPQSLPLRFTLGSGESMHMSSTQQGAVEVSLGSRTVATIAPAFAHDALGRQLATSYSLSGRTLTTHVSIGQETQFPVQVDPVVVGYYGSASGGSWPHWGFYQSCGCVSGGGSGYGLAIWTGSTSEGFGDWHVESGNSEALITRVDLSGASHTSAGGGLYTYFDAGTYPTAAHAIYSYESTNANASHPGSVSTTEEFGGRSIAFCDYGAGGYDGGAQPLCDERYGAEGFAFYLAHPGQTLVSGTAFSQIEDADVHYVQTTPPNEPLLEGPELVGSNSWTRFENPGTWLEGSDDGTGIAAMGVDVAAGESSG